MEWRFSSVIENIIIVIYTTTIVVITGTYKAAWIIIPINFIKIQFKYL